MDIWRVIDNRNGVMEDEGDGVMEGVCHCLMEGDVIFLLSHFS